MGRTGGGVLTPRCVRGTNNWRAAASSGTADLGPDQQLLLGNRGREKKPQNPTGSVAAPSVVHRQEPHVLLVREQELLRHADAQRQPLMPTALERGRLSKTTNAASQAITIYDPVTHLPFAGNVIPANRISPVAAAMLIPPAADTQIDNSSADHPHVAHQDHRHAAVHRQVEHKFSDR